MSRKRVSEKEIIVSAPAPARHKPASTTRVKRTAPVAAAVTQSVPTAPLQEQIAGLAYSYWVARGYQGGSPEADWLRAEQELTAKAPLAATATA